MFLSGNFAWCIFFLYYYYFFYGLWCRKRHYAPRFQRRTRTLYPRPLYITVHSVFTRTTLSIATV